jgi:single-strand DNA-binding protein
MNKVILAGHLGQNVRYSKFESGKELALLRVATKTGYGEKAITEWHNIECWDALARQCVEFLTKGDKVLIEGSIKTYTWEENHEQYGSITRTDKRVLANNVEFMKLKKERNTNGFQSTKTDT